MSRNELLEIQFRVTDKYYGWPDPFIEDGTLVIFVQFPEIVVTEYAAPTDEEPTHWFWDLENKDALTSEAEREIKEHAPHALKTSQPMIFLCPKELAIKAIKRPRPVISPEDNSG